MIHNTVIHSLIFTYFQTRLVKALEDNLDVNITIQNNPEVCIRIQGRLVDTRQAQADILNIFRQVENEDRNKTLASLYAKQVNKKY